MVDRGCRSGAPRAQKDMTDQLNQGVINVTKSATSADVAIIGAGPAGLTAAYLLTKAGKRVTVIEKDAVYVGGISRTGTRSCPTISSSVRA
jgi:ribulose 1,5-bisphosphate synthetase/thiazole synthase